MRILNENIFEIPAQIKEFRRGPDLPRQRESKEQEGFTNPWSKIQVATRSYEKERGGGGAKEIGSNPPPGPYIARLPGPDDPSGGPDHPDFRRRFWALGTMGAR